MRSIIFDVEMFDPSDSVSVLQSDLYSRSIQHYPIRWVIVVPGINVLAHTYTNWSLCPGGIQSTYLHISAI